MTELKVLIINTCGEFGIAGMENEETYYLTDYRLITRVIQKDNAPPAKYTILHVDSWREEDTKWARYIDYLKKWVEAYKDSSHSGTSPCDFGAFVYNEEDCDD